MTPYQKRTLSPIAQRMTGVALLCDGRAWPCS